MYVHSWHMCVMQIPLFSMGLRAMVHAVTVVHTFSDMDFIFASHTTSNMTLTDVFIAENALSSHDVDSSH